MKKSGYFIETERLVLRPWRASDLGSFSAMHADSKVMADQGGPLSAVESKAKLQRYCLSFNTQGYSRWCVVDRQEEFVGYVGIVRHVAHPSLGKHDEIGWRLNKRYWGQGFATEAAKAALDDAFNRLKLTQVFSCTSPDNTRSQAVMNRLSLQRSAEFDFNWKNDDGSVLPVLVWRAVYFGDSALIN
jgi:RimJ/RimL family protein N-acetyltransferase